MWEKECKKCKGLKPLTDFYKHKQMADGHLNVCKECVKQQVRKHRRENDSVREYDRRRYHENTDRRKKTSESAKRFRQNNPEKYKAQTMVGNALRDGKLHKQPCEICGDINVHAHHHDYFKPLDVIWLCAKHHQRLHHSINDDDK